MGGGFLRRLRFSFDVAVLRGMVEESIHRLLQLDVRLYSGENLAHPSDIVLEEVLVQGVRNMQPADECESRHLHRN